MLVSNCSSTRTSCSILAHLQLSESARAPVATHMHLCDGDGYSNLFFPLPLETSLFNVALLQFCCLLPTIFCFFPNFFLSCKLIRGTGNGCHHLKPFPVPIQVLKQVEFTSNYWLTLVDLACWHVCNNDDQLMNRSV